MRRSVDTAPAPHSRIRSMRKRVFLIVLAVVAVLGLIASMLSGAPQ